MMTRPIAPLFALVAASALGAASWAPLPPEAWAVKEDFTRGIRDAVVLEERARFNSTCSEYSFKVRVLTEAGRKAVQFPAPSHAYDFEGRTVKPDGSQVLFNSVKDCTTTKVSARSGFNRKETVLIPPGVTSDCIVELRYKRSGDHPHSPLPPDMNWLEVDLGGRYWTARSVIEMPTNYPWPWTLTGTAKPPVETRDGVYRVLTFKDLPAQGVEPFTLEAVEGRPVLTIYYQPSFPALYEKSGREAYWGKGVGTFFRNWFEKDVSRGSAFKAFASQALQGLEGQDPEAKARAIYIRLQEGWRNNDHLTEAEKAVRPADYAKKKVEPTDLETAAKRGETDSEGMKIALFNLLVMAGLKPRVGCVADRGDRIFNPDLHNLWQLDSEIIGIDVPGKETLWLDPGLRFADPGLIHPAYQGTPGLGYDPAGWTMSSLMVPVQLPAVNRTRFDYEITVGETEDVLRTTAQLSGFPGWSLRMDYLAQEPTERNKSFKESAEKAIEGIRVTKAEVLHVTECGVPFGWALEGTMEKTGGRRRLVRPFPGKVQALQLPENLPATRTANIFMPYLAAQTAVSRIQIPASLKVGKLLPIVRETGFGTASWTATAAPKGDGTEVTVVLKIAVAKFSSTPPGYEELKRFLAAVQEVDSQVLVLETAP